MRGGGGVVGERDGVEGLCGGRDGVVGVCGCGFVRGP